MLRKVRPFQKSISVPPGTSDRSAAGPISNYLIADEDCLLDTTKAKRELGWRPRFDDTDMLLAAYREYRAGLDARSAIAAVPAE